MLCCLSPQSSLPQSVSGTVLLYYVHTYAYMPVGSSLILEREKLARVRGPGKMVDEFMVCVDRILASACLESVDERERLLRGGSGVVGTGPSEAVITHDNINVSSVNNNSTRGGGEGCSKMLLTECRICQEEDEEHQMEVPCACNGTLKFAHRECIQRWCNKKGDITCEICNQVYSPNYTLPPARNNPDVLTIDIRQEWGSHINLRDSHYLALAAAERQFLQSEYEDYALANSGSIACLRSVAIILMLILLIRQALVVSRDFGMVQESSTFFNFQMSFLQLVGFLLPCCVMARSWYIIQSRIRRQG